MGGKFRANHHADRAKHGVEMFELLRAFLDVGGNKTELAKFNADADWRVMPKVPMADGVYRAGVEFMLPKRGPSDF